MNVDNVLSDDAFFRVSKVIAQKTSLHAAVLLADLVSKRKYFKDNKSLQKDGSFYNTVENIENDTTLSKHQQQKAIKELEEHGFVYVIMKGVPRKRFYYIKDENIAKFLLNVSESKAESQSAKNSPTNGRIIRPQESEKLAVNKNTQVRIKKENKATRHDVSFDLHDNGQGTYVGTLFGS